jgi:hypothetical protein
VSAKEANHLSVQYKANPPTGNDVLAELEELLTMQRRKPIVVCNIIEDGKGDTDASAVYERVGPLC